MARVGSVQTPTQSGPGVLQASRGAVPHDHLILEDDSEHVAWVDHEHLADTRRSDDTADQDKGRWTPCRQPGTGVGASSTDRAVDQDRHHGIPRAVEHEHARRARPAGPYMGQDAVGGHDVAALRA